MFDYWKVKNAITIAEVGDEMIALLYYYGFKDKFDYFDEKSASLYVVDDIAVPAIVLNTTDDPFFQYDILPLRKRL